MLTTKKVLVVDDSALMRRTLRGILAGSGAFEVVTARSGLDALEVLPLERPDVITLDVNMPDMDGLSCLAEIMKSQPTPVVMVSSLTERGALVTLEALALGAVDFVAKPGGTVSLNLADISAELVEKVARAAGARVRRSPGPASRPRPAPVPQPPVSTDVELVLVGSSTGGPGLLGDIIDQLPANFPAPVVVAQHLPASFTLALARRIGETAQVRVEEVTTPVPLEAGAVYIGHGDADVLVYRRTGTLMARSTPISDSHRWHPSVDRLVASARGVVAADRVIGVLLTGMGDDGAEEMAALRAEGGRTIAEAEETAVVWGMPGELVRRGGATVVLPADQVAAEVLAWAGCGTGPARRTAWRPEQSGQGAGAWR